MYTHTHTHTHTHTLEQASVITDIIVLYVTRGRHFYREKKYDHAIDPEKMYHFQEHRSSPNSLEEDYHAAV
jgi:hypothetical protein